MTGSIESLLSGEKKFLIWGANSHSYYLARFCESKRIGYSVVDRMPEKRQHLFPFKSLYSMDDIQSLPTKHYCVVICADERRFGEEIKQVATRLGFVIIWQLRELKSLLVEHFRLPLPDWDVTLPTNKVQHHSARTLVVLPKFAVGGAEAQAHILAKALQVSDAVCHLVSLSDAHTNCPKFIATLQSSGVKWSNLPEVSSPSVDGFPSLYDKVYEWLFLNTPTTYLHRLIELFVFVKTHSFNRVISFLDDANIISGIVVSSMDNVRGIMSLRSLAPHHLVSEASPQPFMFNMDTMKVLYQRLIEHERMRCYANSTNGRDSYAKWLEIDSTAISVIYNAIEYNQVLDQLSSTSVKEERHKIEIVGVMRLEGVKGPDDFIRVLKALSDLDIDFHATLVGDGSMRSELERMRKALGLTDKLTFVGEQLTPAPFYANADILLHTSRVEGLPNVILEAQLNGCHVVCTNAGSSLEALHPCYHNYVSDVGDIERLANNIVRLIDGKKSHYQTNFSNLSSWIVERFSPSILRQHIERLL